MHLTPSNVTYVRLGLHNYCMWRSGNFDSWTIKWNAWVPNSTTQNSSTNKKMDSWTKSYGVVILFCSLLGTVTSKVVHHWFLVCFIIVIGAEHSCELELENAIHPICGRSQWFPTRGLCTTGDRSEVARGYCMCKRLQIGSANFRKQTIIWKNQTIHIHIFVFRLKIQTQLRSQ